MAEQEIEPTKLENTVNKDESLESEEDLFEVEQIIGKSKVKGRVLYKVRWKGYGSGDDTWEPKENLESCQDLIEEYDEKQNEIAKKRAEERKYRQAVMEGRADSSESSNDSNSPYPASFKNTFWKELEAGRVNVFDNDMYSKVKKRSETISQTKDTSALSSDDDLDRNLKKKKRTVSNPEKGNSNRSSSHGSKRSLSTVKKRPAEKKRSGTDNSKVKSSKCIDFSSVGRDTESEIDMLHLPNASTTKPSLQVTPKPVVMTDSSSSDEELLKPSINLVIKKVPEITANMDIKCSLPKAVASPSYTVLPKSPGLTNTDKDMDEQRHHSSTKKKKKHHKHHKHKSRKSSPQDDISNEKKRKASVTSLTSYPSERSKGSGGKIPRLDNQSSSDCNILGEHNSKNDNILTDLEKPSHKRDNDHCESSASFTGKTSVGSAVIDSTVENRDNESKCSVSNQDGLPTHDLIDSSNARIEHSGLTQSRSEDRIKADKSLASSANQNLLCQKSGQSCDSGIHSPASEKSEVLGRPVGIDECYLPPLTSHDKLLAKGIPSAQDLDIELDDIDWDLFNTEVTLQPINITNDEFAEAVRSGDYQHVKQALIGDGKYDLEQPDYDGKTLLMGAVEKGNDDITDLLIENGAMINAQRRDGWNALMLACHSAEICTVNLLLELGAKVNMVARDGKTALMIAAMRGHSQILWLLLECGANFNMMSPSGHTALAYLKLFQHSDTEVILTSHINRVMSEFNKQVSITLNRTAKVIRSLFQPQLFNLCDGERFEIPFQHTLLSPNSGVGYLLFIGHAEFANQEVKCRLYGPSAVKSVTLNGSPQACLTEEGNFVLAFSPLVDGRNYLAINTVKSQESKAKLIVCAYMAQLLQC